MDFFERAHISKTSDNKNKKGDENMKKQFKLMLHGYKTSDTKLIKKAENATIELDDSTSVSGFSDLNLTVSSIEENISLISTENAEELRDNEKSSSDIREDVSLNSSQNIRDNNINSFSTGDNVNSTNTSLESANISDSTSDNLSHSSLLEQSSNDFDMYSSEGSLSGSTQSEFDADGKLASQIIEKIKAKDLKKTKRKCEQKDDLGRKSLSDNVTKKSKRIKEKQKDKTSKTELVSIKKLPRQQACPSPPFVSITATDVESIRFDDILGEYRHSTIRTLPSCNQNTISVSNELFTEECTSANVTTEEESFILDKNDLDISNFKDTNISMENQTDSTRNNTLDETDVVDQNSTELINLKNYSMYFSNNNCIFVMKHPSELYFHGQLRIQKLAGHAEIGGYFLRNEEVPVIAPSYSYAQCLKTLEIKTNNSALSNHLKTLGLSIAEMKEIFRNMDKHDVVLLLTPYNNPIMEFVNNNFSTNNLFKNASKEQTLDSVSSCLGCSLYSRRPVKCFEENPSWSPILDLKPALPFKGLVCGGKGSGKSTFLRYYVNRLLKNSPVLVVDLDPGQSEFTVAGNISATVVESPIFGPSFTHLRTPKRSLNIGMISVMDNVTRYVNAVKNLVTFSKSSFPHLPWVINTMGMTNGLGLQLITLIIAITEPNFILEYDSKNPSKRYKTYLTIRNIISLFKKFRNSKYFWGVDCPDLDYMHILAPSADTITTSRSLAPREERYLNFLAYFGQLTKCINPKGWLLEIPPYEVNLKDLYIAVNIPLKDCITKVINGKVVGLCQHNSSTQCKDRVFTLSEHPLLCLGSGLVRGIDWEKQVLYVVTPLHVSKLQKVNAILYADWAPDLRGQEAHLPVGTVVPYTMTAQQDQMELMVAPKRRFNPLQLLKMTRNIMTN